MYRRLSFVCLSVDCHTCFSAPQVATAPRNRCHLTFPRRLLLPGHAWFAHVEWRRHSPLPRGAVFELDTTIDSTPHLGAAFSGTGRIETFAGPVRRAVEALGQLGDGALASCCRVTASSATLPSSARCQIPFKVDLTRQGFLTASPFQRSPPREDGTKPLPSLLEIANTKSLAKAYQLDADRSPADRFRPLLSAPALSSRCPFLFSIWILFGVVAFPSPGSGSHLSFLAPFCVLIIRSPPPLVELFLPSFISGLVSPASASSTHTLPAESLP